MMAPVIPPLSADDIAVPLWVPPELRGRYRERAAAEGEEAAASWARKVKNGDQAAERSIDEPDDEAATRFWTRDRTDRLRNLYDKGLSASAIAAELGAPTRNVVIGKINHLGLRADPLIARPKKVASPPVPKPRFERAAGPPTVRAAVRIKPPAPRAVAPTPILNLRAGPPSGLPLLELGLCQCRWPLDLPAVNPDGASSQRFCAGETAGPKHSFCPTHHVRAYAGREAVPAALLRAVHA